MQGGFDDLRQADVVVADDVFEAVPVDFGRGRFACRFGRLRSQAEFLREGEVPFELGGPQFDPEAKAQFDLVEASPVGGRRGGGLRLGGEEEQEGGEQRHRRDRGRRLHSALG